MPARDALAPLPVDHVRSAFDEALGAGHVVVTAATGTGKSTRLPAQAAQHGPVLVVEPRRIAAVSLAARVAEEAGGDPGGTVGHAVRGDARHGPETRMLFVTPGIALRWLADDGLDRFATVILDEFHERRWDTDLLLALLRDRARHRLVLTSATLDGGRLAEWLGARHLEVPGDSHPVTVEHRADGPREIPHARVVAERTAAAVHEALSHTEGSVLAFLPGRGEIEATARHLAPGTPVARLHGGASVEEQRRALRDAEGQRVVLATNVAETSLTVPGITAVVDSGLERRTARRNGRTVLALDAVSAASADQRAGRAGREAPGRCLRLWGASAPLAARAAPEIQREDLTELVLAAAAAGAPARTLAFPDAPRTEALERAEALLDGLGAIDAAGGILPRGRRLAAMPVDTALAALVLAMPDPSTTGFMADLVATLAAGPRLLEVARDPAKRHALTQALGRRCDATLRANALHGVDLPGVTVHPGPRREATELAGELRRAAGITESQAPPGHRTIERALTAAAAAAPGRVFVRRPRRRDALGNGADEVTAGRDSLFGTDDEAALVLDDHSVPGRGKRATRTVATCMAPLATDALVELELATVSTSEPARRDGRLVCKAQWRLAGRVLREAVVEPAGPEARAAAAELILQGRLFPGVGERLMDDIQAWRLYLALDGRDEPVPDPGEWLCGRLQALGVEHGDDLALLTPQEDLQFDGIPAWERPRFDERYPRHWSLPGMTLRVHYDTRRRLVTVEPQGGTSRHPPQRWQLPAWPGWRVQYRKASRVVDIR